MHRADNALLADGYKFAREIFREHAPLFRAFSILHIKHLLASARFEIFMKEVQYK